MLMARHAVCCFSAVAIPLGPSSLEPVVGDTSSGGGGTMNPLSVNVSDTLETVVGESSSSTFTHGSARAVHAAVVSATECTNCAQLRMPSLKAGNAFQIFGL